MFEEALLSKFFIRTVICCVADKVVVVNFLPFADANSVSIFKSLSYNTSVHGVENVGMILLASDLLASVSVSLGLMENQ